MLNCRFRHRHWREWKSFFGNGSLVISVHQTLMQNQLIYTWANAVKLCLRYLKFFIKTEPLHFYPVVLADYVSTWHRLILILNLFSQQDALSGAALDPSLLFISVFSDAAAIQRCWGFALHDQSSFNENSTVKNNAHIRHFASESFPADLKESIAQKKVVFSLFGSLPWWPV